MEAAILGCGYVGLKLGKLLRSQGHEVIGVRRSDGGIDAVKSKGMLAIKGDITKYPTLSKIPDVDVLVMTANPTGDESTAEFYHRVFDNIARHFENRPVEPRLIYTSSTGVYGDHGGSWVDEETELKPISEREQSLVTAEEIAASSEFDTTIVRLAGIYGPGRFWTDRYLNGPVTDGILNMIHRDDAAGLIAYLIEFDKGRDDVVLGVDDEPVSKWEFSDWLADNVGREKPRKITIEQRLSTVNVGDSRESRIRSTKRCSNAKIRNMGYTFRFPTYREGYRHVV